MDKERFESRSETIGLWKAHDYVPPRGWETTSLDGLLEAVAEVCPRYAQAPEVLQLRRQVQNQLLKLRLPHAQIQELLNFKGKLPDLVLILDALFLRFKSDFPDTLRLKVIELRSAHLRAKLQLFKQGVLGFAPALAFDHRNKVLNAYLDTVQARMRGTQTSNQTLAIGTVVVGAGYALPAGTDTTLGHQLGSGLVPGEVDVNGYQTTWITHFMLTDNNGATTTVASVTDVDNKHFTLTSAAGFQIGDRIEVQSASGAVKTTISSLIGTSVVTEDAIPGLAVTNPVIQIWGESGLKGNADGTTLLTHSQFSDGGYTKTSGKSTLVESAVIERSVG